MKEKMTRRNFMAPLALAGLSIPFSKLKFLPGKAEGKRIGIIGLDTSHSVAFTKSLNASIQNPIYDGFRIVAAYPQGSKDIISSTERIPGYTEDVKKLGVEIVGSIQELLHKVDFVLLETNDGRLHLEQAIEVFKAGKTTFIDKPIAASLADAKAIYKEAEKYKVPLFSASSLRFSTGMQEINQGSLELESGTIDVEDIEQSYEEGADENMYKTDSAAPTTASQGSENAPEGQQNAF
jgi:predicted dehydrogenase